MENGNYYDHLPITKYDVRNSRVNKKLTWQYDQGISHDTTEPPPPKKNMRQEAEPSRLEVKVISMNAHTKALDRTRKLFPQVTLQEGVDLRDVDASILLDKNLISFSAFESLQGGRKWHRELSSKGAVGVAQANRLALYGSDDPLLLLEEDCVLEDQILQEVETLLQHEDTFDIAVFGAILTDGRVDKTTRPVTFMPHAGWFYHSTSMRFILLHCVLYSSRGRKNASRLLAMPIEMQLDHMYSLHAATGKLEILLQLSNASASQELHLSTIQDNCRLCDMHVSKTVFNQQYVVVTLIILSLAVIAASALFEMPPVWRK